MMNNRKKEQRQSILQNILSICECLDRDKDDDNICDGDIVLIDEDVGILGSSRHLKLVSALWRSA